MAVVFRRMPINGTMTDKYANADPYLCVTLFCIPTSPRPVRFIEQDLCVTLPKIERKIAAQTIDVIKSNRDDLVTRGG